MPADELTPAPRKRVQFPSEKAILASFILLSSIPLSIAGVSFF